MHPRTALLSLLAAALLCTGCGDEGVASFTFTEESSEARVEGSNAPTILPLDIGLFPEVNVAIDLEEELAARDATGARAVFLTDLSLELTDTARPEGDEDDFDFIEKLSIFVESTAEGTQLTRQKLAEIDPVPAGVTTLTFDVDDTLDLKPYVEEGMRLSTSGEASVPEDDVTLKAVVTLRVRVL